MLPDPPAAVTLMVTPMPHLPLAPTRAGSPLAGSHQARSHHAGSHHAGSHQPDPAQPDPISCRQRGGIVTILVGGNEWDACKADVSGSFAALLHKLREVQPLVPTAVVTPTLSWREGKPCSGPAGYTPEKIREQISKVVQQRRGAGDANLCAWPFIARPSIPRPSILRP